MRGNRILNIQSDLFYGLKTIAGRLNDSSLGKAI